MALLVKSTRGDISNPALIPQKNKFRNNYNLLKAIYFFTDSEKQGL